MTTVLIILIGLGVVAGLVLRRQGQAVGTGILVICSVLGLVMAVARLATDASAPASAEVVQNEITATQRIMAAELGQYLAGETAGTQALCLLSPSDDNNDAIQAGLTEGLGVGIPVEFSQLDRQDDAGQTMDTLELSVPMVAANLDRHPGTDLLICMADLPYDQGQIAAFLRQRKVRLAAGNVLDSSVLVPYVHARVFAGAAVYRDQPTGDGNTADRSGKEVFDSLYLLLPAQGG